MEINRNNYEEFFLMYVDDELSAPEKRIVDIFLDENPDLKEELSIFQQAKLLADPTILFDHKEFLLAQPQGSKLINLTNYESYFLMYSDNELNEEEKRSVQAFAGQNEKLQKEFSYILRSRVKPDLDIVFKGKETLYRSEKDDKVRVIPWFRIAAAACILLIAGFFMFKFSFKDSLSKPEISRLSPASVEPGNKKNLPAAVTPSSADSLNIAVAKQKEVQVLKPAEKISRGSLKKKQNEITVQVNGPSEANHFLPAKKAMVDVTLNVSMTRINADVMTVPLHAGTSPSVILSEEKTTQTKPGREEADLNNFTQAVGLSSMGSDTENGFSVLTTSTGKSTMRGFFRKVSRVFEKTTRVGDDDEKKAVLIGNFQIALK